MKGFPLAVEPAGCDVVAVHGFHFFIQSTLVLPMDNRFGYNIARLRKDPCKRSNKRIKFSIGATMQIHIKNSNQINRNRIK